MFPPDNSTLRQISTVLSCSRSTDAHPHYQARGVRRFSPSLRMLRSFPAHVQVASTITNLKLTLSHTNCAIDATKQRGSTRHRLDTNKYAKYAWETQLDTAIKTRMALDTPRPANPEPLPFNSPHPRRKRKTKIKGAHELAVMN